MQLLAANATLCLFLHIVLCRKLSKNKHRGGLDNWLQITVNYINRITWLLENWRFFLNPLPIILIFRFHNLLVMRITVAKGLMFHDIGCQTYLICLSFHLVSSNVFVHSCFDLVYTWFRNNWKVSAGAICLTLGLFIPAP